MKKVSKVWVVQWREGAVWEDYSIDLNSLKAAKKSQASCWFNPNRIVERTKIVQDLVIKNWSSK